jgi:hypothetical protein
LGVALIISCQDITGTDGVSDIQLSALAANPNAITINNQADLAAIETDPSLDYVLGASFTVTNWIPICDPNNPRIGAFEGHLDGAGNTITIQSFDTKYLSSGTHLGIFVASDNATFSNLTVNINAGIVGPTTATYAGGLVGQAVNTQFEGITVNGSFDLASNNRVVNAGLVAGFAGRLSHFLRTNITADLNVLYTGPDIGVVNAGGVVGYLENSTVDWATINGQFAVNADMPYTYSMDNGVRLGGVAGYAENGSSFLNTTVGASTSVDAQTTNNPVYVGGVLGKGNNITITNSTSDALVFGEGPGYNTSAGGVAGYIVNSMVTHSSASGDVTLGASWGGTTDTLWMIYTGGLVGYSGGDDGGGSEITSSSATGNVTASSPYPYAGGLVGYNYGFNTFSSAEAEMRYYRYRDTSGITATTNGGKIIRSYATGNAAGTAATGSNGLPYVGGLAGYSSIGAASGSNIENCYATGNATAVTTGQYSWAGGLLGANAQNSIITTSYATGNVSVTVGDQALPYPQPGISVGAAGGGIAGVNYYTAPTLIQNCVALNTLITGTVTTGKTPYLLHRIAGDLGATGYTGTLNDNYANREMVVSPVWNTDFGLDGLDGVDVDAKPPQNVFVGLGWDFSNVWIMGANGYPALR